MNNISRKIRIAKNHLEDLEGKRGGIFQPHPAVLREAADNLFNLKKKYYDWKIEELKKEIALLEKNHLEKCGVEKLKKEA